jgi:hypothetical protein
MTLSPEADVPAQAKLDNALVSNGSIALLSVPGSAALHFRCSPKADVTCEVTPGPVVTTMTGSRGFTRARVDQRAFAEPNAGSAGLLATPMEIIRPRAVGCFSRPPADWGAARRRCRCAVASRGRMITPPGAAESVESNTARPGARRTDATTRDGCSLIVCVRVLHVLSLVVRNTH